MSKKKAKQKTVPHHLYGDVPLVEVKGVNWKGEECSFDCYDPNFQPKIPSGGVKGDITKQVYSPLSSIPHYYYVDRERTCVQCGRDFVFSAKEQKYWFETLQFVLNSEAIRCPECRKKKRSEKALSNELGLLRSAHQADPKKPHIMLEIARVICSRFEHCLKGDLEEAIAFARKALRGDPPSIEGLYWEEGLAQRLSGRETKSKKLFREFLDSSEENAFLHHLRKKAVGYLETE